MTWLQPHTLAQLMAAKAEAPHARIIAGNSEVGIEVKFRGVKVRC
jgi:xanthine dehydrogenase/oxidase